MQRGPCSSFISSGLNSRFHTGGFQPRPLLLRWDPSRGRLLFQEGWTQSLGAGTLTTSRESIAVASGREGRSDCGQIVLPAPEIMELVVADVLWALGVRGTARKVKNHEDGELISKILAAWRNDHIGADIYKIGEFSFSWCLDTVGNRLLSGQYWKNVFPPTHNVVCCHLCLSDNNLQALQQNGWGLHKSYTTKMLNDA